MPRAPARWLSLLALTALLGARVVRAQDDRPSVGDALVLGARAIPVLSRATPTIQGQNLTEAYLSQPTVMLDAAASWLSARGTLDLEGLTERRGELTTGAWGEGFVDRRHPHTYLHELMLGATAAGPGAAASLFAGRGFVPFGSDDPMMRPLVKFPVDHHFAQIAERVAAIGAVRTGPLILEAATFNGDEPVNPSTPPLFRRFGDSWAARGTLAGNTPWPIGAAELTASYAWVRSPEYREGHGLDQRKRHLGFRVENALAPLAPYALVEWAQTEEVDRGRRLYTFAALLGEAAVCRRGVGVAFRVERSDRPEEERLLDLFREPRPATDVSILGVTRWTTLTGALSYVAVQRNHVRVAPFVEISRLHAERASLAVFDPATFYGSPSMWMLSAGFRVAAGSVHRRMGRYGAAETRVPIRAAEAPVLAGGLAHDAHHSSPTDRACFF